MLISALFRSNKCFLLCMVWDFYSIYRLFILIIITADLICIRSNYNFKLRKKPFENQWAENKSTFRDLSIGNTVLVHLLNEISAQIKMRSISYLK